MTRKLRERKRILSSSTVTLINRKDPTRAVVQEAERILQEVKGKAQYLIPFRLMLHLPDHESILRPVDTVRVSNISSGISTTGFRRHEPCCTNDPIPEIGVCRYILGGNHRVASARDSGQVLIPTNRVSTKHVRKLMRVLREEDQRLIDAGILKSHFKDHDQALRCLEILTVSLQSVEPSPKPLSCLQQVQLIRTALRNDPSLDIRRAGVTTFGGAEGLQKRIFPGDVKHDDSRVHFLLNASMGHRHKTKLVKGVLTLLKTEPDGSFSVPEIGDHKTLLDLLIYWESKGQMEEFLETHLSYIGPLTPDEVHTLMRDCHANIQEGKFNSTPFGTVEVRNCTKRKRGADSDLDSDAAPKKRKKTVTNSVSVDRTKRAEKSSKKNLAARSRDPRQPRAKSVSVSEDSAENDIWSSPASQMTRTDTPVSSIRKTSRIYHSTPIVSRDSSPKRKSGSVALGSIYPKNLDADSVRNASGEDNGPFPAPNESAVVPIASTSGLQETDQPGASARTLNSSTAKAKSAHRSGSHPAVLKVIADGAVPTSAVPTKVSQLSKELQTEKEKAVQREKEAESLRRALQDSTKLAEENLCLAVEKERRSAKERYKKELASLRNKASLEASSETEKLRQKLVDRTREKDEELARQKSLFEYQISEAKAQALKHIEQENQQLRSELEEWKSTASQVQVSEKIRIKKMERELSKLRKKLEDLQSTFQTGRRVPVPTMKMFQNMIANMPSARIQELKGVIEEFEKKRRQ